MLIEEQQAPTMMRYDCRTYPEKGDSWQRGIERELAAIVRELGQIRGELARIKDICNRCQGEM